MRDVCVILTLCYDCLLSLFLSIFSNVSGNVHCCLSGLQT